MRVGRVAGFMRSPDVWGGKHFGALGMRRGREVMFRRTAQLHLQLALLSLTTSTCWQLLISKLPHEKYCYG